MARIISIAGLGVESDLGATMARTLRSISLGLVLLTLVPGPAIPQTPKPSDAVTTTADKPSTNKPDTPPVNKPDAASSPLPPINDQIYSKSLAALTELFVVALLLESAFAVIFNWRVFLAYFSLRGVRTIIMIAASWLVVSHFGLDVMATLIAAYKSPPAPDQSINPGSITGGVSQFVTALILAGGSSGVNRIMTALGFRSPSREEEVVPHPPANKAWVAVRVNRKQAKSEVLVCIKEIGPPDANSPSPIAGMISFKRTSLPGLLFREVSRFPQNGGHTLAPNTVYSISVEAKDANNNPVHSQAQLYVFAPGAIVDLEIDL
jgi:hypothetical protein